MTDQPDTELAAANSSPQTADLNGRAPLGPEQIRAEQLAAEQTAAAKATAAAEARKANRRRMAAPAAEPVADEPAAPAPCDECAEREASLEARVDRVERLTARLYQLTATLAIAAVVVYVLAGREQKE